MEQASSQQDALTAARAVQASPLCQNHSHHLSLKLRVQALKPLEEEVAEAEVVVERRPPQRMRMAPIPKLLSYPVDVQATSLVQGWLENF